MEMVMNGIVVEVPDQNVRMRMMRMMMRMMMRRGCRHNTAPAAGSTDHRHRFSFDQEHCPAGDTPDQAIDSWMMMVMMVRRRRR